MFGVVPSIAGSTIGGWTTTKARRSRRRPRLASARRRSVCHVVHHEGSGEVHFSRETVERLLASERFFWLDLDQPERGDFEILRDVFRFHPLAVEDSEQFGQRAKIDEYDDFVFLVVYGAVSDEDRPRRGSLLLLRALPRHRPPRRLPRVRGDPAPLREAREADRRTRRCCSTGSSTGSSTASSRSSPTSTTASTSSRTASSAAPTTRSSRRSSG